MSFGAGMGAGMGAGIGAGIAIGVSSGEKRAVQYIRDHVVANELTVHDRMGKEVDLDQVLQEAVAAKRHESQGWRVAVMIGIAGLAALALATYLFLSM
jgi:hypothetical protein